MPTINITNNTLENLTRDIKKAYFKEKEIKTYNNICKLIEKMGGFVEIEDNATFPYFKKHNDTFTIFIPKYLYSKINEEYYEHKLVYEIAQCLSVLFLVCGYGISNEIWDKVPEYKQLDGIIYEINKRKISPETSHYFTCALLIGKDKYLKKINEISDNGSINLKELATLLNVNTNTAHTYGYYLGIFNNI